MNIQFYTADRKIKPELLDQEAKQWAEKLITQYPGSEPKGVKRHQFRRLFEEAKRLQKTVDKDWAYTFPMVKMLKSKTAYAVARAKANEKDPRVKSNYDFLKELFYEGINQVKEVEDYKTFCIFVEAVYGFYYELGGAQLS